MGRIAAARGALYMLSVRPSEQKELKTPTGSICVHHHHHHHHQKLSLRFLTDLLSVFSFKEAFSWIKIFFQRVG